MGACGRSAAGSASPCQGEGRGFESRRPLCAAHHAGSLHGRVSASFGTNSERWPVEPVGTRRGGVAEWLRQGPAKPCTRVRFPPPPRAISSVGERYLDTVEVTGSIPVSPTSTTVRLRQHPSWWLRRSRRRTSPPAIPRRPTRHRPRQRRTHRALGWPPRRYPVGTTNFLDGRRRQCGYFLASTARKASFAPERSLLISPTIDPTGSVLWVTT